MLKHRCFGNFLIISKEDLADFPRQTPWAMPLHWAFAVIRWFPVLLLRAGVLGRGHSVVGSTGNGRALDFVHYVANWGMET
jgi:hypothetical protein